MVSYFNNRVRKYFYEIITFWFSAKKTDKTVQFRNQSGSLKRQNYFLAKQSFFIIGKAILDFFTNESNEQDFFEEKIYSILLGLNTILKFITEDSHLDFIKSKNLTHTQHLFEINLNKYKFQNSSHDSKMMIKNDLIKQLNDFADLLPNSSLCLPEKDFYFRKRFDLSENILTYLNDQIKSDMSNVADIFSICEDLITVNLLRITNHATHEFESDTLSGIDDRLDFFEKDPKFSFRNSAGNHVAMFLGCAKNQCQYSTLKVNQLSDCNDAIGLSLSYGNMKCDHNPNSSEVIISDLQTDSCELPQNHFFDKKISSPAIADKAVHKLCVSNVTLLDESDKSANEFNWVKEYPNVLEELAFL